MFEVSAPLTLMANWVAMSTLTVHTRWKDQSTWMKSGHPPSYAEAKKMVTGQNGIGQNGMDKMVRTKWHGQNGSNFYRFQFN